MGGQQTLLSYDAKHKQWLISTLPLAGQADSGLIGDVAVSRSTDGIHWGKPIIIDKTHEDDKNWTTCDNTPTSPYYGNCCRDRIRPTAAATF